MTRADRRRASKAEAKFERYARPIYPGATVPAFRASREPQRVYIDARHVSRSKYRPHVGDKQRAKGLASIA